MSYTNCAIKSLMPTMAANFNKVPAMKAMNIEVPTNELLPKPPSGPPPDHLFHLIRLLSQTIDPGLS